MPTSGEAWEATVLDPITFEILRHRLWTINDEQGKIAARISGSPIVYDVKDFSASLLTPTGDSLFIGPHVTRLSIALHRITKSVLALFAEAPGINDGDMFFTNDPWAGAAHQNDQALVAPVFYQDEIVAWTGIAMHDVDVGGPTLGGFTPQTLDAFNESPLIPPIKLVERGVIRRDLEALVVRNTRTSELNALNIRSRMAAQNVARRRILETIEEYGKDALLATQQQVIATVQRAIARRLAELPDGVWQADRSIDHDGYENRLLHIRLTMTKQGEHLTLDFRGTDKQTRGAIHCAPGGLDGGVYSAILPMLCYDMAWCPAALEQAVEIISEPGTLNNADFPAAVGTATVGAIWATGDAVRACLAKMLACSDQYRAEAQATWAPGMLGAWLTGPNRFGRTGMVHASLRAGGAGAGGARDGLDAGGPPGAPTLTIENVEGAETHNGICLVLYRKLQPESLGAGQYRGGAGIETMLMPYGHGAPLAAAQYSQGHHHPESKGVYGGYPGAIQGSLLLRNANVAALWAAGRMPTDLADVTCERVEVLPAKGTSVLGDGDLFVSWYTGGAGYGDPLERAPALVQRDLDRLLLAPERARELYGAVLDAAGRVDAEATVREREATRLARIATGAPVERDRPVLATADGGERLLSIAESVDVLVRDGQLYTVCARCGHVYGDGADDPKRGAYYRHRTLDELSRLQRFATAEEPWVLREYFCPGCGVLVDAQVVRPDDPVQFDTRLRLAVGAPA